MDELLAKLESIHPWLDDIVVSTLLAALFLLLWFVFSYPADVLHEALSKPIDLFVQYIRTVHNLCLKSISSLKDFSLLYRDKAIEILQLQFVFDQNVKILNRSVGRIAKQIDEWAAKNSMLDDKIILGNQKMMTGMEKLQSASIGSVTIDVPPAEEQSEYSKEKRTGIYLVILSIPIMIALVGVNTLMLREYFSEFVDKYVTFGMGIKLSDVLAFFFTLLEIALGVLLYKTQKSSETANSIRTPIMEVVVILAIFVLGFIELVLYLFLSTSFRGLDPSVVMDLHGLDFVTTTWLALFGPVIVFTLAATGHMLVNGVEMIVESGHGNYYKIETDKLSVKVDHLKNLLKQMEETYKSIQSNLTELSTLLSNLAEDELPSFKEQLLERHDEFKKALADPSENNEFLYQVTNKNETLRHFYKYSFLAIGGCVVMVVFTALQINYLSQHTDFIKLPFFANIIIATVASISVPWSAYMITAPMRTVAGEKSIEGIRSFMDVVNVVFGTTVILVVIYFLWHLTSVDETLGVSIGFLVLLVCTGVLVLFGRTLATLINVFWADMKITALLLPIIPISAIWLIALFLKWIAVVFHSLVYVVAYPRTLLRKKNAASYYE